MGSPIFLERWPRVARESDTLLRLRRPLRAKGSRSIRGRAKDRERDPDARDESLSKLVGSLSSLFSAVKGTAAPAVHQRADTGRPAVAPNGSIDLRFVIDSYHWSFPVSDMDDRECAGKPLTVRIIRVIEHPRLDTGLDHSLNSIRNCPNRFCRWTLVLPSHRSQRCSRTMLRPPEPSHRFTVPIACGGF